MEKNVWITGCESGACVQAMDDGTKVLVTTPDSWGHLPVSYKEWEQFKQAVKDGKFD